MSGSAGSSVELGGVPVEVRPPRARRGPSQRSTASPSVAATRSCVAVRRTGRRPPWAAVPTGSSSAARAAAMRVLVDHDHGRRGRRRRCSSPRADRVPAAAAAGLVDRGPRSRPRGPPSRGVIGAVSPVDGDVERLAVRRKPSSSAWTASSGCLPADRDAGHLGAARHLVAGEGVRRDVGDAGQDGESEHGQHDDAAAAALGIARRLGLGLRVAGHGGHPRFRTRTTGHPARLSGVPAPAVRPAGWPRPASAAPGPARAGCSRGRSSVTT